LSETAAEALAERPAQRIEADILNGALAPNSRLGIADTAARYGVGATPLRETLSRLSARGLVSAIGKRGFRVKSVSREDLADIVRIGAVLECKALRLSMEAGEGAWGARSSPLFMSSSAMSAPIPGDSATASPRSTRSTSAFMRVSFRPAARSGLSPPVPASMARLTAIAD